MKIACTLVPTLRLWKLSQTPQLPKPESAREQNDGVLIQGHLGFQNGGIAGKGEPGGVIITDLPSATFRRTGLRGSVPHQLPVSPLFYLPFFCVPSLWFYETLRRPRTEIYFQMQIDPTSICYVPLTPPSLPTQAYVSLRFKTKNKARWGGERGSKRQRICHLSILTRDITFIFKIISWKGYVYILNTERKAWESYDSDFPRGWR